MDRPAPSRPDQRGGPGGDAGVEAGGDRGPGKLAGDRREQIDFSRPGKPTDNAHVEAFNGRLREECLKASFLSLADARDRLEA